MTILKDCEKRKKWINTQRYLLQHLKNIWSGGRRLFTATTHQKLTEVIPDQQLSPNFRLYEFLTLDKQEIVVSYCIATTTWQISDRSLAKPLLDARLINFSYLAWALEAIRAKWNKPIRIHSGYRTVQHNKDVGGHPQSLHRIAKAVDFSVHSISARDVQIELTHWCGGLGAYETFTHIDLGVHRRWNG